MLRLFLIRHGQTDLNKQNIVQGSGVDAPLNETGRAQAAAFFRAFGDMAFDHVYTSALQRAQQSVQGFLDRGLPHTVVPGLNEISWGKYEGTRITPTENSVYHQLVTRWQAGDVDAAIDGGGESPRQVTARQRPFVEELTRAGQPDRTVLVCMHGRAMRILLCQLLHVPLAEMDVFVHENLCLYELLHTGTLWQVRRFADLDYALAPAELAAHRA